MARKARPWQVALLVTGLALAWQTLLVYGYFGGRWSALFLASDRFSQSLPVREEGSYVLPGSGGYDGQFYHAIAHDPLDLRETDRFLDFPPTRYTRILLPALSYALGFGRLFWVDRVYRALELAGLFLGVFCVGAWAESRNRSVWWGAAFLSLPGVFISLERQLADLPLCALLAAALLSQDRREKKACWVSLASAGLVREMGFVAIGGFMLAAAREKRWKDVTVWASAAIPGAIWNAYVFRFIPHPSAMQPATPILNLFVSMRHLQEYPFGLAVSAALHGFDRIAIAGGLLSLVLGLLEGVRKGPLGSVGVMLACFGVAVSGYADYKEVYSFARAGSPLLLIQLFQAIETGSLLVLAPLGLMLPRSLAINARMTILSIFRLAGR
ncbi:MAG TPA: hypothetical protein VKV74_02220 [Bryobacteraceae bacterium]|nr:hypothetical protein [Bryobacteraceae bacterium]